MRQNEFLFFWSNYLEKITVEYVMYVCCSEARACLYRQTGARKKNSVYKDRCTFVFYGENVAAIESRRTH